MLGRLFVLFTVVPVLELYLLISIGRALGAAAAVAIVLVTGVVGAALARREGSRVLRSWQAATERGEIPKDGVISSLLVPAAGVLLIAPGVLTDVTGLLLLVPPIRRRVAVVLKRWLERRFQLQAMGPGMMFGMPFVDPEAAGAPGDVIDATAVEVDANVDADAEDVPSARRAASPASLSP